MRMNCTDWFRGCGWEVYGRNRPYAKRTARWACGEYVVNSQMLVVFRFPIELEWMTSAQSAQAQAQAQAQGCLPSFEVSPTRTLGPLFLVPAETERRKCPELPRARCQDNSTLVFSKQSKRPDSDQRPDSPSSPTIKKPHLGTLSSPLHSSSPFRSLLTANPYLLIPHNTAAPHRFRA